MPDLLFINKDAQSSSLARSTAAKEKASINAHVQRGRKHVRRDRMPILLKPTRPKPTDFALRREPELPSVAGILAVEHDLDTDNSTVLPPLLEGASGQASLRLPSLSSLLALTRRDAYQVFRRNGQSLSRKEIGIREWIRQQQLRDSHEKIARQICSNGSVTDPFGTSCIKIDQEIYSMLQHFVLGWHPNAWPAESRLSKGKYTFASGAKDVIRDCLGNEMYMFSVLACMAARLQIFYRVRLQRDVGYYITRALTATQKRIEIHQQATGNTNVVNMAMIVSMYYIGTAEWYRLQLDAAAAHAKRLKQIVDRLGGLRKLDSHFRELLGMANTYLAAERFSEPIFDAAEFDPGSNPIIETWRRSHHNIEIGCELLRLEHLAVVSPELQKIVADMAEYISVLLLSQQNQDTPPGAAHWAHARDLATRTRLLAMRAPSSEVDAVRIALAMWNMMAMTVSARVRTIKLMAPKLVTVLGGVRTGAWSGHEAVLCWILTVGSMSAAVGSAEERWFVEGIARLMPSGWNGFDLKTEEGLAFFSAQFFYMSSMQRSMVQALAQRIAGAVDAMRF